MLIEVELTRRVKVGHKALETLDKATNDGIDLHNVDRKKLKYLQDTMDKAGKQQGQHDPQLLEKLAEMAVDAAEIATSMDELETRIADQKRRRNEAKKRLDEMGRNMGKFQPSQVDDLLLSLDELADKSGACNEKLRVTDTELVDKVKELEECLANCDTKQGLQGRLQETEREVEDDLTQLRELLDRLPPFARQLRRTATEMKEIADVEGDYADRKDEIGEHLDELDELDAVLEKFEDNYKTYKQENTQLAKSKEKARDIE